MAVASGAAAALGVSDRGVNSLVGVAISASLLPPVVNTGMCISYGLSPRELSLFAYGLMLLGSWGVHLLLENNSKGGSKLLWIALVSVCLFLVNYLCIVIGAMAVFLFKKIRPIPIRRALFWNDLPEIIAAPQVLCPSLRYLFKYSGCSSCCW